MTLEPGQAVEVYAFQGIAWQWYPGRVFVREEAGVLIVRMPSGRLVRMLPSDVRPERGAEPELTECSP